MSKTETKTKEEKGGFISWLLEDDSPEIGIASKESLPEYIEGVKAEFKKIHWPSKEQLRIEFFAVIVIVAIITVVVFGIDLGLDKVVKIIRG